jgi:hypothetical protein
MKFSIAIFLVLFVISLRIFLDESKKQPDGESKSTSPSFLDTWTTFLRYEPTDEQASARRSYLRARMRAQRIFRLEQQQVQEVGEK